VPRNNVDPLPQGETKPCMRGTLDKAHYDLTGEIKMVEEFQVFVPPVVTEAEVAAQKMVRRRPFIMSNKPKKEDLEKDLRAGLPIADIARKYESTVMTVHNWIKSYGLAGIRGVKKSRDEPVVTPTVADIERVWKTVITPDTEMVQESPPDEIEQVHADDQIQESPKGVHPDRHPFVADPEHEFPPIPEIEPVEETLEEIWWGVEAKMMAAQRKYAEQADKDFRAHLVDLIHAVTNGRGI